MNIPDKAKELVNKFAPCVPGWDCYYDSPRDELDVLKDAKRCAYYVIDELISELESLEFNHDLDLSDTNIRYWKEVKNEIEKL